MRTSTVIHMISGMFAGFVFLGISFINPHKGLIIRWSPLVALLWSMGLILYAKRQPSEGSPQ